MDDLGLREWYENLPNDEREKVHEYSNVFTGGEEDLNVIDDARKGPSSTQQSYLKGVGSSAVHHKDYEIAEKVLLKALDAKGDNPTDRHFIYNSLIELYYKQRDERDDAIEKCIKYCKEDIDIVDDFLDDFMEDYDDSPPRIPSFKRLAIIYEKQERHEEAIDVCEKAIQRDLTDKTKGGFEGRKERLEKKKEN